MNWKDHNRVVDGAFHLPFFPWFEGWRFGIVFTETEAFFGWYKKE